MVDCITNTIDLAIIDHGLEVSDGVDAGDFFLCLVIVIVLAHLEALSLLFFDLLFEFLLLTSDQVLPIDSLLLPCSALSLINCL